MTTNPQIVIAALKHGQAGFVHEAVSDPDDAVRVIIGSNPDAFVVGYLRPRQSVSKVTKELRRLIMRELLVETSAPTKRKHRNRFELFQIGQGRLSAEFIKAENHHVGWIREGFNVKHVDVLLDQMTGGEVEGAATTSSVSDTGTVAPGLARQRRLLEQEQWLDSLQLHQRLNGRVTSNASQMAARLRAQRKLVGVQVGGVYLHPRVSDGLQIAWTDP